jgi:hypothetical protein
MTIPTAVCWSEELEWVLMLKDQTIDTYLLGFPTDPAKAGYDVSADLVGIELGRNAVLDEAWESYQWGKAARTLERAANAGLITGLNLGPTRSRPDCSRSVRPRRALAVIPQLVILGGAAR